MGCVIPPHELTTYCIQGKNIHFPLTTGDKGVKCAIMCHKVGFYPKNYVQRTIQTYP